MADRLETKKRRAQRRRLHVRQHAVGTAERPRMTVFRSLRHMTVQLVDDAQGRTLLYWSTQSPGALQPGTRVSKTEAARLVGKKIGELALAAGIKRALFDRNRNRYHGRVRAVAEGAREAGLQI
jgi:large subunit ribosomal protein L18